MNKIKSINCFCLLNFITVFSQETLIINSYNRSTINLNGEWNYIVDPYENGYYNYRYEPYDQQQEPARGAYFLNSKPVNKTDLVEYNFDKADKILVPGDWNTQNEKLFYYEGTMWYKKSFDYTKSEISNRVFIYFGAVNYRAEVYLNGNKLGTHIGGFTPFNFEVTDQIKQKDNFLIVKVDNKRLKEAVPTLNTDWLNYGGITRDVKLIETGINFIEDYIVQLNSEDNEQIKGYIRLNGPNISQRKVRIKISDLGIVLDLITNQDGYASFEINVKEIIYWSNNNPYLYQVEIKSEEDKIIVHIGFRSIETSGNDILLNGEKIFLKGICIHEENSLRGGRAYSLQDAIQLLTWAEELGCNYVRLAHYPHNEHMVRLADKIGILVWEEIPVYWTISWENQSTYTNAENQLSELIHRDKNRASVIIWSMANETPSSDARNVFLAKLAEKTRQLDPTRLISAALEQGNLDGDPFTRTINDSFADMVDILSFNQYIGWYDGIPEKCGKIKWKITQNKPVLISEFGAGAKYGFRGDNLTRWTEEYQELLYIETLKMIDKIPQLRGISPWILVDFRSPRRVLPEIQDGWNRKGLISEDGLKKKAFYTLMNYYKNNTRLDNGKH
jgi:beta-glucuronidase